MTEKTRKEKLVEEIEMLMATIQSCKLSLEDCSFRKCSSWGKCEIIKEAVSDFVMKKEREAVEDATKEAIIKLAFPNADKYLI